MSLEWLCLSCGIRSSVTRTLAFSCTSIFYLAADSVVHIQVDRLYLFYCSQLGWTKIIRIVVSDVLNNIIFLHVCIEAVTTGPFFVATLSSLSGCSMYDNCDVIWT